MKSQRSRRRWVVLVAMSAVVLAGCGRPEDDAGGGSTDGGIPTVPGFDGETISLGIITASSGPIAPVAAPLIAAEQAWAQYVNANGGIGGYRVELNVTDSAYNPAQALQQYERTKSDVVMFADVFGTPIVQTLLPRLTADDVLAMATTGEGSLLRERQLLLGVSPYESQIVNGIEFAVSNTDRGGDDAVVCGGGLEGPLADAAERGVAYAGDELGVTTGPTVSLPQAAQDATPQVLQLQDAGCDIVVLQGVPPTTIALTSAASRLGYAPQFVATSTGYAPVAADNPLYDYLADNLLITADVVPFGDESAAGMDALVSAHDTYAADTVPSIPYVNGWVNMLIVQSVLKAAVEAGDLSQAGLVEASNSLSTFDLQGIGGVWQWGQPQDRKGPDTFSVYRPDAEQASGVAVVEAGVQASAASQNYPY